MRFSELSVEPVQPRAWLSPATPRGQQVSSHEAGWKKAGWQLTPRSREPEGSLGPRTEAKPRDVQPPGDQSRVRRTGIVRRNSRAPKINLSLFSFYFSGSQLAFFFFSLTILQVTRSVKQTRQLQVLVELLCSLQALLLAHGFQR